MASLQFSPYSVAIFFSSVSTSFYFPFFGTIAIYLAGSGAQEVYEYITGPFGKTICPGTTALLKGVYYLLPNFAAFDFKVHAVYALPLTLDAMLLPTGYFVTYTGLLLGLAVWVFNRRELP